jgi:IclR family transcriptional regulator, acetate operon repressor
MKQDRLIIQSIERGIVGLEMAISGGVRAAELAERLGVDRSTAYRILYTLMQNGYLLQDEHSNKFVANHAKIFQLSSVVAESRNWVTIATERLKDLRDLTQQTANLAVKYDAEMVIIARELALETPTVLQSLGARRPVHCSATGKAVIAYLSEAEVERIISQKGLAPLTSRSIVSPDNLRAELVQVRQQGYAVDDEETLLGVRCIASPVFDYSNRPIAAIGISGPISILTREQLPDLANKVQSIARETSEALGAKVPKSA